MVVRVYSKPSHTPVASYLADLGNGKPVVMHFAADWHYYSTPAFSQMLPVFKASTFDTRFESLAFVRIDTQGPEFDRDEWRLGMRGTAPTFVAFDEDGVEIFETTKKGEDGVKFFLEKFLSLEKGTFDSDKSTRKQEKPEAFERTSFRRQVSRLVGDTQQAKRGEK